MRTAAASAAPETCRLLQKLTCPLLVSTKRAFVMTTFPDDQIPPCGILKRTTSVLACSCAEGACYYVRLNRLVTNVLQASHESECWYCAPLALMALSS